MWDRGLAAYYLVWLLPSQYNKYIRDSGWYLLMMVACYVSLYRIRILPGYRQDYGSSKSAGTWHRSGTQGTYNEPNTQNG